MPNDRGMSQNSCPRITRNRRQKSIWSLRDALAGKSSSSLGSFTNRGGDSGVIARSAGVTNPGHS